MNRAKRGLHFVFVTIASLMCFGLLCFDMSDCDAAPPAGAAPTANANEVAQFKGTLKGFENGLLQIDREDGKAVLVQPPTNMSMFTFVANAKLPFLQRGMLVRFNGTFHANGVSVSPIEKVEIFQAFNLKGVPGHGKQPFTPGVHPKDKHAKPGAMAAYQIVGNLVGIDGNGTIAVQAGKQQVNAKLAQTVVFEIRLNNLNLAKPGDPVSVSGFYNPPDDTKIRGDRVTITTDRIYGEPQEKEAPVRRGRRSRTKVNDGDKAESAATGENAAETTRNDSKAKRVDAVRLGGAGK